VRVKGGAHRTLRADLLADATELRDFMVEAFIADPELARAAAREYGKLVDDLAAGRECWLYRWQLPDDVPQSYEGTPGDILVLGVDDRLRERD